MIPCCSALPSLKNVFNVSPWCIPRGSTNLATLCQTYHMLLYFLSVHISRVDLNLFCYFIPSVCKFSLQLLSNHYGKEFQHNPKVVYQLTSPKLNILFDVNS